MTKAKKQWDKYKIKKKIANLEYQKKILEIDLEKANEANKKPESKIWFKTE